MFLTIFTPTYNRRYTLQALYDSLLLQTDTDFEWLVIDDGSTDDTEAWMAARVAEGKLCIRYLKQENAGKHRAINRGTQIAAGALFFIVDSDDKLTPDAVAILRSYYNRVADDDTFAGVFGTRMYPNGKRIGGALNFDCLMASHLDIRMRHRVRGDLAEAFKTAVLKEYPYPEIPNEKFSPESLVWNRIAQRYKTLLFNRSIYICEYLPDGLTAKMAEIRMRSPLTAMILYAERVSYAIPMPQKLKAAINFWRFSFHTSVKPMERIRRIGWLKSMIGAPIGYLMYRRERHKIQ